MTKYRPFRKKKPYGLTALIIAMALFLSFSAFNGLFGIRYLLNGIIYPFQFIASSTISGIVSIPGGIIGLKNLSIENAELKIKLQAAGNQLIAMEELASENKRLNEALSFQSSTPFGRRIISAKVIAKGAFPDINTIEISRGANSGVTENMPVIVPEGMVGKVIEVFPSSSRVLLATDVMQSVAGVDLRSRDFGVVEGYSPSLLTMRYVNADGDIKEGDKIVTSSISSLFPAGIPIGTVKSIKKGEADLFFDIKLAPAVSFSKLEEVFLVY